MNKKELKSELDKAKRMLDKAEKSKQSFIQGCNFTVENKIIWDNATVEVMDKVAEGLLTMTKLFAKQNISLESMLKIDGANNLHISGGRFINENIESESADMKFEE